jgi:PAS domain S-box-containing protein
MTRKGRLSIPAPVWVAALGFLVAGFVSLYELTAQQQLIFQSFRTGTWMVVQLEAETMRLDSTISARVADPASVSADDVGLALDLLYSRIPLLLVSEEAAGLRDVKGFVELVRNAQDAMPELERAVAALDPHDPATYTAARGAIEKVRKPVRDAVQLGLITDRTTFEQRMRRGQIELFAAVALMMMIGVMMVGVALVQSRRSARLGLEAQEAAEAAEVARGRLVDALNAVSEAFVYFGPDGRLVMANERFRQLHRDLGELMRPGLDYETFTREIVARGLVKLDTPADEWIRERLDNAVEPRTSFEVEMKGGRIVLVSERRTREGGLVSVRTDVTEITRARELLANRLHAMEASLDGIALADKLGRLIYANLAFAHIYGYARPIDLIGRPWRDVWDPAETDRLAAEILPRIEADGRWLGETSGLRITGQPFPQEVSLTRLADGGLALVVHDITERKNAEIERATLREQFFNAQKLEAIGRLAGGIAHDFNNILAAVNGYAHLLVEDLPAGSETQAFARQILLAGERAKDLVKEILAFSRTQQAERTTIRLHDIVDETLGLLRATLPSSIRVDLDLAARDALVDGNATQISQVLMNLCVNARDAIEERRDDRDGIINVTSQIVEIDGGCAEGLKVATKDQVGPAAFRVEDGGTQGITRMWMGVLSPGPHVKVSVRDTGTGMTRKIMERIFDPFFTTKDVGKGTGLGLAAVHGIVTQHGGAITIESRLGEGTVFAVFLPIAQHATGIADDVEAVARAAHAGASILVVDDEDLVATMIARSLERLGYEVACTTDSDDALEAFAEDPNAFDLVVTDQTMPSISGMDLAKRLLAIRPDLPIILCTGFSETVNEGTARAAGIAVFLTKPVHPSDLAAEVARVFAERAPRGKRRHDDAA